MSLFDKNGKILVSASQITSFMNCNKYWYINKILKEPVPFTPAFAYGKKFHSCIENSYKLIKEGCEKKDLYKSLMKTGKYDLKILEMISIGWKNNIFSNPTQYLMEHNFKLKIEDFGIMRGAIDFYDVDKGTIQDHKTIASKQYALDEKNYQKIFNC